jgi:hypothetical protein
LAMGDVKLLKKAQNIRRPPTIVPGLEPRCPWANRCQ